MSLSDEDYDDGISESIHRVQSVKVNINERLNALGEPETQADRFARMTYVSQVQILDVVLANLRSCYRGSRG
jgi:hypothetical protein